MDSTSSENETLRVRVQQLEQERDQLHNDIEQLCIQQAGPTYLGLATKLHFQRISGLEQEIENLKTKLTTCSRENLNLQEELSQAYRIKSQVADLHSAEVAKNVEAEKMVKFFQSCVASAFAERDNSMMEAEKAKENEEFMSKQFNHLQKRIDELTSDCSAQKKLADELQASLELQAEQNETFMKVINKFYQIRQYSAESSENTTWDSKCACLLHDAAEMWSFNDATMAKYISALESELDIVRKSADNLQNKLRMGLDIENHLRRRVRELEKKSIRIDNITKIKILELHQYHSECRIHIQNLLDDGKSLIKSVIDDIDEKIKLFDSSGANITMEISPKEVIEDENECRDVHINDELKHDLPSQSHIPDNLPEGRDDASSALAMALQDKVATLLLLSQQEERHLLDGNVNTALQRKIGELQRNLLQVTNEKVRALMELAQLKQDYQLLKEKIGGSLDKEKVEVGDNRKVDASESGGRLAYLMKKTNLKRWVGTLDIRGNEAEANLNNNMDFARMKIENVTLKESMESMEHLISLVHRLRLSLNNAKESVTPESKVGSSALESLGEIINETKLLRTALGSSLPVSWSADTKFGGSDSSEGMSAETRDTVGAAGIEMVELLILAAQVLKDYTSKSGS